MVGFMSSASDTLVVAVLGPGRLGETHVAALSHLRERGLDINGRHVDVFPALYGRNAARVQELAERYGVERTSTTLEASIDAAYAPAVHNCLPHKLHRATA